MDTLMILAGWHSRSLRGASQSASGLAKVPVTTNQIYTQHYYDNDNDHMIPHFHMDTFGISPVIFFEESKKTMGLHPWGAHPSEATPLSIAANMGRFLGHVGFRGYTPKWQCSQGKMFICWMFHHFCGYLPLIVQPTTHFFLHVDHKGRIKMDESKNKHQ